MIRATQPTTMAFGDYDRTRALIDGSIRLEGIDPTIICLEPEEVFFRAMRHAEFGISELSFSSHLVRLARGDHAYTAIPVFLSRAFRHTAFYVNTRSGITSPQDLIGRRVGLPEYQLTACVWARAILQSEYGIAPDQIHWIRGGVEHPGREEKVALELPGSLRLDTVADRTLNQMLIDGEIDAFIGPRAPSAFDQQHPAVRRLFEDPVAVAREYHARTGIFPIMHVVGIRNDLLTANPWLAASALKGFEQARQHAMTRLNDTSASKVMLPFVEERLADARALMGADFWRYGVAGNEATLEAFLEQHHAQGLSKRRIAIDELFPASTREGFVI